MSLAKTENSPLYSRTQYFIVLDSVLNKIQVAKEKIANDYRFSHITSTLNDIFGLLQTIFKEEKGHIDELIENNIIEAFCEIENRVSNNYINLTITELTEYRQLIISIYCDIIRIKNKSLPEIELIALLDKLNKTNNSAVDYIINDQDNHEKKVNEIKQERFKLYYSYNPALKKRIQPPKGNPINTTGSIIDHKSENDVVSKKRILFICSSPTEQKTLDFGHELKKIEDARKSSLSRDKYEKIEIKTGVEFDDLPLILSENKPNILHISLHASKIQGLYFENKEEKTNPVNSSHFADLIKSYNSNHSESPIETLVLSACNSYTHAEAVQNLCQHVVGMQDFFPDTAASLYTKVFYENLFNEYEKIEYAHQAAQIVLDQHSEEFKSVELKYSIKDIPVLFHKE